MKTFEERTKKNIEILESTDGGSGGYSLFDGDRGNADRDIQQTEGRKLSTNTEGSNENLRTGNNEISTEAGSIESASSVLYGSLTKFPFSS